MKKASQLAGTVLLIALLSQLTGCVTRGSNFSSNYNWLKEEKTTRDEVVKTLGEPYHVGYSAGKPTWTYGFYKMRLVGESYTKELKIYWKGNIVDTFSFNSSFPEDKQKAISNISN